MAKKRSNEHIKAQKEGKEIEGYVCAVCGKVDKKNHGHHIIYYSEDGAGVHENIITLCPECHRLYHSGKLNIDILRF
ncbi:HNH endonuclease [Brachyspira hampsonii]|uniref:HNH endonuclease n=1 Tax=Brachyspira hampsonii TaxID=1287055 RepID=UPI000D373F96|nr:HNH endonuclease [Brachyspira hampsonii]PTY41209.1 Anaredoxin [Brachyspira hampsonii bv. II]